MLSFLESSFLLMEVASFRHLPFFLSGNLFYYLIFCVFIARLSCTVQSYG